MNAIANDIAKLIYKVEELSSIVGKDVKNEIDNCQSKINELLAELMIECDKPFVKAA